MKKKDSKIKAKKLRLSRETLRDLSNPDARKAVRGNQGQMSPPSTVPNVACCPE